MFDAAIYLLSLSDQSLVFFTSAKCWVKFYNSVRFFLVIAVTFLIDRTVAKSIMFLLVLLGDY